METSLLIVTSVLIVLAVVAGVLLVVAAGRRRREKQRLEAVGPGPDAEIDTAGPDRELGSAAPTGRVGSATPQARETPGSADPDRDVAEARSATSDRLESTDRAPRAVAADGGRGAGVDDGRGDGPTGGFGADDTPTPPAGRPAVARHDAGDGSAAEAEARTDRFLVSDFDRAAATAEPSARTERLPAVSAPDRSGAPAPDPDGADRADRAAYGQADGTSALSAPAAGSSGLDAQPIADAPAAPTSGRHRARPDPADADDTDDDLPTGMRGHTADRDRGPDPAPPAAVPGPDRTGTAPPATGSSSGPSSAGPSSDARSPEAERPRTNRTDAFLAGAPPAGAPPTDTSSRTDVSRTHPYEADPSGVDTPGTDAAGAGAFGVDTPGTDAGAGAPAPVVADPVRSRTHEGRPDDPGHTPSADDARAPDHASGPAAPAADNSAEPTTTVPVTEDRDGGTAGRPVPVEGRSAPTGNGDRVTVPDRRGVTDGTASGDRDVATGDRADPMGDAVPEDPDGGVGARDDGDRRSPVRALADRLLGRNR